MFRGPRESTLSLGLGVDGQFHLGLEVGTGPAAESGNPADCDPSQIEHPYKSKKAVWHKLLSKQRRRAVVACFRMTPLYNMPT